MSLLPLFLLMAGSVGANQIAEKKVERARNRALDLAMQQRDVAQKKSAKAAQSTADLFVQAAKGQDARAAEIEEQYKTPVTPTPASGQSVPAEILDSMAPASTSTIETTSNRNARARAYADEVAAARAKLAAFGDVMVGANIGANRNAMDINQQATNLSNWNQFVLPQQLEAANRRGRSWNTAADVLQAAAQLYSVGALSAPAGAVNTASTGALGASTSAAAGATNTAAADYFAQQQLLDFAKNLRMPGAY